jgi:hypothetical protein
MASLKKSTQMLINILKKSTFKNDKMEIYIQPKLQNKKFHLFFKNKSFKTSALH